MGGYNPIFFYIVFIGKYINMNLNELYKIFTDDNLFEKLNGELSLGDTINWTFDGLSENIIDDDGLYSIYEDDLDEINDVIAINNLEDNVTIDLPIIINNIISFDIT